MTAPISRPAGQFASHGRLWWLPAGGCGNGLDDTAWAPVLEISERVVPDVLVAEMPRLAREAAQPADSTWR